MTTSKSPKKIASVAYESAKQALPLYSHRFSPKKFTQPQLVACLVLKEFFKADYRGLSSILDDSSDLQDILELKVIPHFTTLQKQIKGSKTDKGVRSLSLDKGVRSLSLRFHKK